MFLRVLFSIQYLNLRRIINSSRINCMRSIAHDLLGKGPGRPWGEMCYVTHRCLRSPCGVRCLAVCSQAPAGWCRCCCVAAAAFPVLRLPCQPLSLSVFSRYFSTIHARAAAFQTKSSKCQLHSKMLTLPPVVPSISSTPAGQNYIYDIIYIYKYMYVYIYDIRYICGHT